jgi:alkaline phosphatase
MKMLFRSWLLSLGFWVQAASTGSVVFLHPDGAGLGHWNAARLWLAGPDGRLNWDRMDALAVYHPHQRGWLSTTSHAGATVHAFGKKVHPDSFGMDQTEALRSASDRPFSIMAEALKAGMRCGVVNSGHIAEPGTAVFLASSSTRADKTGIARKVVHSGAQVIFCGGEIYLLPKGVQGVHGRPGVREDGIDVIQEARDLGYIVVFTREDLLALPADTPKVLGLFAGDNTFNDRNEEQLQAAGLPAYDPESPTFAEMTRKAMEILSAGGKHPFFLVAEEEGTDNFSNATNAKGMLDAVARADAAIGEVFAFLERYPDFPLMCLVAADSDAGHPSVWAPYAWDPDTPLPLQTRTGAALDGVSGAGSKPFLSQPDAYGQRHAFGIAWPYSMDMPGSGVVRVHGVGAEELGTSVDNTRIFRLMHSVLFGGE